MSLLGNLFTIIPFIKNKKNAIYVIIVIVIENMNTLPHSLPPPSEQCTALLAGQDFPK